MLSLRIAWISTLVRIEPVPVKLVYEAINGEPITGVATCEDLRIWGRPGYNPFMRESIDLSILKLAGPNLNIFTSNALRLGGVLSPTRAI